MDKHISHAFLQRHNSVRNGVLRVYYWWRYLRYCLLRNTLFWFKLLFRTKGIISSKQYKEIRQLKNCCLGETCFIVGTGPSLSVDDLEKIKGLKSFSMNSIVLLFERTTWRPTYYAIQDNYAVKMLREKCDYDNLIKAIKVFRGVSTYTQTPILKGKIINFPLYILDHDINVEYPRTRFSHDINALVYDGYTITYSIMQIACYMGFKQIVLIGVDCDYSGQKKHFTNYTEADNGNAAYLMCESYKVAEAYAKRHGISILNATRNARLDVFKRVNLDEFLRENGL